MNRFSQPVAGICLLVFLFIFGLGLSCALFAHEGHSHGSEGHAVSYFLRGDSTGDGLLAIGDALWTIRHLNHVECSGYCAGAGDLDADGQVTVSDVVATLSYLFMSRCPPPSPFPECTNETTLGCRNKPAACN